MDTSGTGGRAREAALREELARLGEKVAPRFGRREVRDRAARYLAGLLGPPGRRTGRRMAARIGEGSPDGTQRLLNGARWDADGVRDDLRDYVVGRLGEPGGVLVLVETGFPKKGERSVGVAPQRNPATGNFEHCQVGLFLAYASARGWAFVDRALYLPEAWARDGERRARAGVPKHMAFATKGELARGMLGRAFGAGVPAAWVTGGGITGRDGGLRRWLEGLGRAHVLPLERTGIPPGEAYSSYPRAWVGAASGPAAWERVEGAVGDGGMPDREWAGRPLAGGTAAGWERWLPFRRTSSGQGWTVIPYRAYCPEGTALPELARAAEARRAAEEGLERAKGEVGLDEYEVRRWEAWHRHVTLCLLAHAAVAVARAAAGGDVA